MKKNILFLGCFLVGYILMAQEDAWVYLTDKPNASYYLEHPTEMLTQKALDRKNAQNIAIDLRDVPVHENYITQLKAATGITVMAKSKWFNAVHVRGSIAAIKNLSNLSFVSTIVYANKNQNTKQLKQKQKAKFQETTTTFNYGSATNQTKMLNIDKLHEANFTGAGVTIAVLDGGFPSVNTMMAFKRLRDAGNIKGVYDFVDRDDDVYSNTTTNHGTLVLSVMAAYIETEFVGVAPDASYYLFITEDGNSESPVEESYWVEAAERADSLGVNVINTSLGYSDFDNSNYSYTSADMNGYTTFITKGANIAFEKGLLLVNSAGNSGSQGITAPADSPNVFTIGAVNAQKSYVTFSSVGSDTQPTFKPDVMAQGAATSTVTPNNTVVNANGTSFSSPIIAGAMACLKQALPNVSNQELMQIVRESASLFTNPNYQYGYGIPDFWTAYNNAVLLVENRSLNNSVILYPNPTSHNMLISTILQDTPFNVAIYNTLGKRILSMETIYNNTPIDVSRLPNGIYIVSITTNAFSKSLKLLKN